MDAIVDESTSAAISGIAGERRVLCFSASMASTKQGRGGGSHDEPGQAGTFTG